MLEGPVRVLIENWGPMRPGREGLRFVKPSEPHSRLLTSYINALKPCNNIPYDLLQRHTTLAHSIRLELQPEQQRLTVGEAIRSHGACVVKATFVRRLWECGFQKAVEQVQ